MGKAYKFDPGHFKSREARREYQRRYYQMHKEKAKEYQCLYNLTHKKKQHSRGKANFMCPREARHLTFNSGDIMNAPAPKAAKMIDQILRHERLFTI